MDGLVCIVKGGRETGWNEFGRGDSQTSDYSSGRRINGFGLWIDSRRWVGNEVKWSGSPPGLGRLIKDR